MDLEASKKGNTFFGVKVVYIGVEKIISFYKDQLCFNFFLRSAV